MAKIIASMVMLVILMTFITTLITRMNNVVEQNESLNLEVKQLRGYIEELKAK